MIVFVMVSTASRARGPAGWKHPSCRDPGAISEEMMHVPAAGAGDSMAVPLSATQPNPAVCMRHRSVSLVVCAGQATPKTQ